ncbi:hypothetical protein PHYSODRAFT_500491, partial [Phytophthora sojae]
FARRRVQQIQEAQRLFDPRYLCSVYLYGLRRLGTTFITFSSLAKLEQRVRARFGIHEVVSIYRERLQRVSSLEHVNDGDTLCITQNAYDDMTILCDWMKKRQQVLHGFQHQAPRSSSPQLWDSNGRSIGVKTQHAI